MVLEDLRDGTSDYSVCKLADEMIDNTIGVCTSRRSHKVAPVVAGPPRLRQTLRKKTRSNNKAGAPKPSQGQCGKKICNK